MHEGYVLSCIRSITSPLGVVHLVHGKESLISGVDFRWWEFSWLAAWLVGIFVPDFRSQCLNGSVTRLSFVRESPATWNVDCWRRRRRWRGLRWRSTSSEKELAWCTLFIRPGDQTSRSTCFYILSKDGDYLANWPIFSLLRIPLPHHSSNHDQKNQHDRARDSNETFDNANPVQVFRFRIMLEIRAMWWFNLRWCLRCCWNGSWTFWLCCWKSGGYGGGWVPLQILLFSRLLEFSDVEYFKQEVDVHDDVHLRSFLNELNSQATRSISLLLDIFLLTWKFSVGLSTGTTATLVDFSYLHVKATDVVFFFYSKTKSS